MTFSQFIAMIKARWLTGVLVMATVVLATATATLLMPRQYTASAAVYVDGKAAALDPMAGIALPGVVSTAFIATQADLIKSERVMRRALRSLGLDTSAEFNDLWVQATKGKGDREAWQADLLAKKLEVKPSRESSVILLNYTSPDANFSAAMANAIVQAYVDLTLEMRVEPAKQYRAFFDKRAAALRSNLEEAQKKLLVYQEDNGILPTDERIDIESARLAELNTQLITMQTIAAESSSRQQLASGNPDNMQEVLNSGLISSLTADLARQEAKYEEMNQRYGQEFPEVKAMAANIAQLKVRIASEVGKVSSSIGVNGSVNRSRLAQLAQSVEAQRKKILDLKSKRDAASLLIKDVDNAKTALDAVQGRMSQVELESQNTQTNVTVVKQASAPVQPSSPLVVRNLAVALIMGAILGVVSALAREMRQPRLLTAHDIEKDLDLPLMAVLPRLGADTRQAGAVQRLMQPAQALLKLSHGSPGSSTP